MRVLVTGGHGFIGTHLVARLREGGAQVRCVYRRPGIPASLAGQGVDIVRGDVRVPDRLDAACRDVDEIYHLAGLTSSLTRRAMRATNTQGTRNLLEAAERAGFTGRFVYCSSLAALGPSADGNPLEDAAPPRPVTWYGCSKRDAEAIALGRPFPFTVTVLRPPAVYGPGDLAFLPLFTAARRGLAVLPGQPTKRFSFIYGDDLARAFIAAARAPATAQRAWLVAHPEVVTLAEAITAAERAVGRRARRLVLPASLLRLVGGGTDLISQLTGRASVLGSQRMREVAEGHWVCSPRALEEATGWRARVALTEGYARTAAWYRERGLLR